MTFNSGDAHSESLRQQTMLARFGELALRSDDLDEILTEACRLVGEALGTDLAKIMQLQEDRHTLLVRSGIGWKPGVVGVVTVQANDDTSEGVAIRTGEPIISPDVAKETRFSYPAFLLDHGVRAVANVPIIGGQDKPPFGILQVDSRQPREFTEADTNFLSTYANLVAAAVGRLADVAARELVEKDLQRSHERLETRVNDRTRELVEANEKLRAEAEERGRVEEALRQAQKMEAVGQLTGGLAHDFNNLLGSISGNLELMNMRAKLGIPSADIESYVTSALSSVARASALTHRLLAFSRRQTLDPKSISVNDLIGNIDDMLTQTVGLGVHIKASLADDLWMTMCDPNQLINALLNLANNARDAMPSGGTLTIETANIIFGDFRASGEASVGSVPAGDYVALSVTDSGTGMTQTVLEHVFDPFFTTKPIGQGTGLGLSMVHGFVKQSGGHVVLSSKEGKGTKVTIYLPRSLNASETSAAGKTTAGLSGASGAIVLVVEDELPLRAVIAELLSGEGCKILQAGTGGAALSIVATQPGIELMVTDVGLPGGMNGRQLADAARVLVPNLRVLFITGYADGAAVGNGLMEPGMEVMTKPFALDAFSSRVHQIMALAA